jgi:hypothetical protein
MKSGVPDKASLSIAIQTANLRRNFPFGTLSASPSKLRWQGAIKHDDTSRSYNVELIYKIGDHPEVFVREPNLKLLAGDRKLPHVYDEQTQLLCLYVPGCNFWSADKLIASTIMPWTCLWFRHFENWLVTDIWHGLGHHPTPKKPLRKNLK